MKMLQFPYSIYNYPIHKGMWRSRFTYFLDIPPAALWQTRLVSQLDGFRFAHSKMLWHVRQAQLLLTANNNSSLFFGTSCSPYCHTLASGAASAPMGALQAIRFAIANCGCLHDCNLLDSRRIAGICQSRAIARPPKKQADSLTLNAIHILERAPCQAAHVYDQLCFGTFLIALYSLE